jgi:hypothetical protein
MRDWHRHIRHVYRLLWAAGLVLLPTAVVHAGALPDEVQPQGSWFVRVLLPGLGMGLALGLVLIIIMQLRIRALRASSKSEKEMEALELEAEETQDLSDGG